MMNAGVDRSPLLRRSRLRRAVQDTLASGLRPPALALLPILTLQAVIALVTLHNTAFQDEALYLYAGEQIFRHWTGGPPPYEQYATYFSGYPYLYPVLGGVLDQVGGLELARAFSLLCMLGVTALTFACARLLFPPAAAVCAAAAYAFVGSVLYVSRLATYDAPCLLLLALAAALAYRAGTARYPWTALGLGPVLVLSILVKYAALLFVPSVLGLVVFGGFHPERRWSAWMRFAIAAAGFGVSLAFAYHFMDPAALRGITSTTTSRNPIFERPRLEMLVHALYLGGAVWGLALAGLLLVVARYPRHRVIASIALCSSGLTPAYHIYKQESVSFDKHIAFSLFFAMPLAGYAVAWLAGSLKWSNLSVKAALPSRSTQAGGLAGVAVVLIVMTLGMRQSENVYAGWGNTSTLTTTLHTQLRDGSGRYFAEDIEVVRYDAKDITEAWQWTTPYYFDYVTGATHQHLFGRPALAEAIKDRYFSIVELSFVYTPDEAFFVAGRMAASHNYDLIAKVPYQGDLVEAGPFGKKFGSGYYYMWRSALSPGKGTFTDISQVRT